MLPHSHTNDDEAIVLQKDKVEQKFRQSSWNILKYKNSTTKTNKQHSAMVVKVKPQPPGKREEKGLNKRKH